MSSGTTDKENGIRPIVLIVPKAEQLEAADFPRGYNPRRPQDSILKAMAGKALCIDLLSLLQEETTRHEGPYWWNIPHDGHFSEEGHAFVKSVLLKYLGKEKTGSIRQEIEVIGAESFLQKIEKLCYSQWVAYIVSSKIALIEGHNYEYIVVCFWTLCIYDCFYLRLRGLQR